jgi:hypothetical protein
LRLGGEIARLVVEEAGDNELPGGTLAIESDLCGIDLDALGLGDGRGRQRCREDKEASMNKNMIEESHQTSCVGSALADAF